MSVIIFKIRFILNKSFDYLDLVDDKIKDTAQYDTEFVSRTSGHFSNRKNFPLRRRISM